MSRTLYQTGGPFGPVKAGPPRSYPKVANPWVQSRADFGNIRQLVGATSTLATSATVAGIPHVGCCAACSASFRQGS